MWYKLNIFTRWQTTTNSTSVIIFDPRPELKYHVLSTLEKSLNPVHLSDPYYLHTIIAEEGINFQNAAVWGIRDMVRNIELNRSSPTTLSRSASARAHLHDVTRHAIHVSESVDSIVNLLENIMQQHTAFLDSCPWDIRPSKPTQRHTHSRLHFQTTMAQSLRGRSASNKERLLNEIQLSFHTIAQHDALLSVEIGRAAQEDSSSMKTIAYLTAAFLPATFISSLFSMSFFDFDAEQQAFSVSSQLWIYWAVSIPVTLLTCGVMYVWRRWLPQWRKRLRFADNGELAIAAATHHPHAVLRAESFKIMNELRDAWKANWNEKV
jgi:hypothetical protein